MAGKLLSWTIVMVVRQARAAVAPAPSRGIRNRQLKYVPHSNNKRDLRGGRPVQHHTFNPRLIQLEDLPL